MAQIFEGNISPKEEMKPLPAESFEIEFINTGRVRDQLSNMGFVFTRAFPEGDKVIIEGESTSRDGTHIEIIVTKGEKYKSPKEIEEEIVATEQK